MLVFDFLHFSPVGQRAPVLVGKDDERKITKRHNLNPRGAPVHLVNCVLGKLHLSD